MAEEKKKLANDEDEIRWYVVNTYSGHENRVKDNLEKRLQTMGLEGSLFRIVVAEEPEIEVKNGKQTEKMRNMFPGYLFVEMKMTDEAWYVVRNTPGVTGFIGSSGGGAKPFPVSPDEMDSILRRIGQAGKTVSVDFGIGDTVKILRGSFANMVGRVNSMNDKDNIANVLINMFGRETPTDFNYTDLELYDPTAQ